LPAETIISENLIKNGDLADNQCKRGWCAWNKKNFKQEYIPHWQADNEIEIGNGNVYSDKLTADDKIF
jgi:hypothetical protein